MTIGKLKIAKFNFEPGWTWEKSEKPLSNADSCALTHNSNTISRRLGARTLDSGVGKEKKGTVQVTPSISRRAMMDA